LGCLGVLFVLLVPTSPCHAEEADHGAEFERSIARGIDKLNTMEPGEALPFFEKALELAPGDPEALYYAGTAQALLHNLVEAEAYLLQAFEKSGSQDVCFELGLLYYRLARWDKAREYLDTFMRDAGEDERRADAEKIIELCRREQRGRRFFVTASVGGEYDSNVTLEPDTSPVGGIGKSDFRAVFFLAAGSSLPTMKQLGFSLDYNFYQTLHEDLDDFDVHYHRVGPKCFWAVSPILKPALSYAFDYTRYGGESYSREHMLHGSLEIRQADRAWTEAVYRYSDRDYQDSPLFERNSERSGDGSRFGLREHFTFRGMAGQIYGFLDSERAREAYWSFDGYRLGGELRFAVRAPFYLYLSGEYYRRQYKQAFPLYDERRDDSLWQAGVSLSWVLTDRVTLMLTDRYMDGDSNLDVFEYKRNMAAVFASASFP
jgi:tetratricopeptide (TPR) repeat protein